ncbi:MAG: DUF308 domain-containing protein [Candidatus Saccharibacteria bacterium]|nr:DUF308 domain-containing protein [Candidatus Saccharibacteria bacterium]
MNKLVKRGLYAYKIFLKNKIAMSLMMLFSGVMMFIAALNGKGNDTKTLPLVITIAGAVFSFWAFYRLGYVKSNLDGNEDPSPQDKKAGRRAILLQSLEALVYIAIAVLGVFLLVNEGFTNKILNLMAGGFTTFNGVLGVINAYKYRNNKDFRWKFMLVLTVIELAVGPYFIFASDTINTTGFIIMGVLTTVAGIIEVISALTMENIKGTIKDGKDIVRIIKDKPDQQDPNQYNA